MSAVKRKPVRSKSIRPPRRVWIVWNDAREFGGIIPASASTRQRATDLIEEHGERVVGPFVLSRVARWPLRGS